MHSGVAVALVLALLLPVAAVTPAAGADQVAQPVVTPEGFDSTVFQITLYANGSARWTISHRRVIENETDREAFERFATHFERNETALYETFTLRAERLTASVGNFTGRDMRATRFAKRARVDELGTTRGIVSMSFTWSHLARVEGQRIVMADIFDGGFYIATNQRLVVRPGGDLRFSEARPAPDSMAGTDLVTSDSVTWFGEQQFADQRPQVVVGPENVTRTTTGTGTPADGGFDLLTFGVLILLAAGLAAGLAWRAGAFEGKDGGATTADSGDPGDGGGAQSSEAAAPPEPELLTDEDRVIQLLEANDGRMKQVNIVDETGWSKSKVSMLLSDMDEAGDISKLRVGRENIISLRGEEPDAAGSPFEDDE